MTLGKTEIAQNPTKPELIRGHCPSAADTPAADFRAQVAEAKQELKANSFATVPLCTIQLCMLKCSTLTNSWTISIQYRPQQENLLLYRLTFLIMSATNHYCYRITGDPAQHNDKKASFRIGLQFRFLKHIPETIFSSPTNVFWRGNLHNSSE